MADYAIGDIQGCYEPLMRLLDKIQFNERQDRLYFVGDLVNRGPDSLAVLRFIKSLPFPPGITLGNHDLHLLALMFGNAPWRGSDDTLCQVIKASDAEELGHWLRQQSILIYEPLHEIVLCHAGIYPGWDLTEAISAAKELEAVLQSDEFAVFLGRMYNNEPSGWSQDLQGIERLRFITNSFTRMRFCHADGRLDLTYKGKPQTAPAGLYPWFEWPGRKIMDVSVVFGHWASLEGKCAQPQIEAIDTGCLWGGELTALCLSTKKRYAVPA